MLRDGDAFLMNKAVYRLSKLWVLDPVQRVRAYRLKSPNNLVLALRPSIVTRQATPDGKFYTGVVAEFKVQVIVFAEAAPIATIKTFIIEKVQRTGDRLIFFSRYRHGDLLWHGGANLFEKLFRQIAPAAIAFGVGALVKLMKKLPGVVIDLLA